MTVLTQNVLGVTNLVLFAQISCGPSGCGSPSPDVAPAGTAVQPSSASPPRH